MTLKAVVIVVALGLSCAGGGLLAQGLGPLTQGGRIDGDRYKVLHAVDVFAGTDVGIRITGPKDANGRVPGMFVVRIEGQWVEVAIPAITTPGPR